MYDQLLLFLDHAGREFGPALPGAGAMPPRERYAPIADSASGRWDNRPYFVDALAHLQQVVVSSPYRSVTGSALCVTLTIATQRDGHTVIAGADLDWRRLVDAAPTSL